MGTTLKGVIAIKYTLRSKTTLNYWMMVEIYPNHKEEVGGSIPGYEISSLLDINLALACRPSGSNFFKNKKTLWSLY